MLWLKVPHAVRMGKQLSKCERNPRDYKHTQNVTSMQDNPGVEQLTECSLIEDTTICEQGHATSPKKQVGMRTHKADANDEGNKQTQSARL